MIVLGVLGVYLAWALFFSGPKFFPSSYVCPAIVTIATLVGLSMTVGFA